MELVELRAQRTALHLTQAELAQALGVARNTVARWERGELAIGRPELVTLALERLAAESRDITPTPWPRETRRSNLPSALSSFVGREVELIHLRDALTRTRLLTLTGAGGMGKTRLALRLAPEAVVAYDDGIWLIELGPLRDATLVPNVVASILGLTEHSRRPALETLVDALRGRGLLLVLDNCEHVLGACADLVEAVLRAAPGVRVLATSREVLGVDGEATWQVQPLGLPSLGADVTADHIRHSAAGRLLIERAQAAAAGFVLRDEMAAAAASICHGLDGMPLALELAAARLDHLTMDEVAARPARRAERALACSKRCVNSRLNS
jgi:non-specific serine/threonine protein kinase